MYVMGILTERKESDHISILHFGIDDTGFKQLYEDGGFNPDNYDLEVHYPMIGEGTVDDA
jgi:hypothetical protein